MDIKAFLSISGLAEEFICRAVSHFQAHGRAAGFYRGGHYASRKKHISYETLVRYLLLLEDPQLAGWILEQWQSHPTVDPRIKGDFHTHSIYSDGLGSPREMIAAAASLGYRWFTLTDHAPADTAREYRLTTDKFFRRRDESLEAAAGYGIRVYQSIEADIAEDGRLNIPEAWHGHLDFALASFHKAPLDRPRTYLQALERALSNEIVRGFSHPFWGIDIEGNRGLITEAIDIAVQCGVAIELNLYTDALQGNHFLLETVKKRGGTIIFSTDAHHCGALAHMRFAGAFLHDQDLPEVLNFHEQPF